MRTSPVLRVLPRAAIFVTAFAEMATGDVLYGVFCLVALALTLIPALRAKRLDAGVPLELELALLWLLVTDMTLGNWLGLYRSVAWYDKALHLGSSVLIGTIGFLAVYVLHVTYRTRFHPWLFGIAVLLVTLGIGALWEIAEYAVDGAFGRASQTSPGMNRIDDTMLDLVLDGIGGIVGAILGTVYMQRSRRSRRRAARLAREIARHEHAGAR
jgi:hypothetical protein